jgi:ABC-2 type transport system permease protein
VFVGLIALVVAGAMFITAEYRRGMIRITLAASPRRGRVLAAKAIVLGVVSFVATLIGAAGAVLIGDRLLSNNGYAIYPASATTEVQVIAGTAALAAAAAIFALGVGAIVRNGAAAVTIVITAIILPYVLAVTLNVLSAGASDWLMRVTLAATPRRLTVLAAKAAVLTGLVLVTGTIAILASLLVGGLILPGHGIGPSHGYPALSPGDGPVLRAALGSVLYLVLVALLSLGVATAVREAAASIGVVLGLLYLFSIIADVAGNATVSRHLEQIVPMTAGLAIQATTGLNTLPISPWAGLGVLAAWAAGVLLLGGLLFRLRDA